MCNIINGVSNEIEDANQSLMKSFTFPYSSF